MKIKILIENIGKKIRYIIEATLNIDFVPTLMFKISVWRPVYCSKEIETKLV